MLNEERSHNHAHTVVAFTPILLSKVPACLRQQSDNLSCHVANSLRLRDFLPMEKHQIQDANFDGLSWDSETANRQQSHAR